ncbi:hypothetical protein OJ252_907 [Cryptosporidium canis]|uniref:Uncharacterized protein n=1 Tax=Cryptosporidium canis TaxID=195482 RepID=A0ABQ8P9H4_9CRYT|nr:hypothetical protein OJ252_907 [Cryptosporidium canis]
MEAHLRLETRAKAGEQDGRDGTDQIYPVVGLLRVTAQNGGDRGEDLLIGHSNPTPGGGDPPPPPEVSPGRPSPTPQDQPRRLGQSPAWPGPRRRPDWRPGELPRDLDTRC